MQARKEPSTPESSRRRVTPEAEGSRLTREGNDEQPDPVSPEHRKRERPAQRSSAQRETMAASTAPSNPATLARPPPERHKITCSAPHGHAGKARRRALKNGARDSRPKRQRHGCDGPGQPSLRRAETPLWSQPERGGDLSTPPSRWPAAQAISAKLERKACRVASMSASLWASEVKPASKALGAR